MTENPDALEWAKQQRERKDSNKENSLSSVLGIGILAAIIGGMIYVNREASELEPAPEVNSTLQNEYKVNIGEIAKIDATEEPGESFTWTVLPADAAYEIDSSGKILYLSSGSDTTFTIVFSSCNEGRCAATIIHIIVGNIKWKAEK